MEGALLWPCSWSLRTPLGVGLRLQDPELGDSIQSSLALVVTQISKSCWDVVLGPCSGCPCWRRVALDGPRSAPASNPSGILGFCDIIDAMWEDMRAMLQPVRSPLTETTPTELGWHIIPFQAKPRST